MILLSNMLGSQTYLTRIPADSEQSPHLCLYVAPQHITVSASQAQGTSRAAYGPSVRQHTQQSRPSRPTRHTLSYALFGNVVAAHCASPLLRCCLPAYDLPPKPGRASPCSKVVAPERLRGVSKLSDDPRRCFAHSAVR